MSVVSRGRANLVPDTVQLRWIAYDTVQLTIEQLHWPEPPAACDIAAWPAAVAASLERFRSASTYDFQYILNKEDLVEHTGFLLSLDLRDDSLDLRQIKALPRV